MGQRRFKVLVIAESANPEQTSVALIGWSLSRALLAHADVHVVTHVRNRDALKRAGWSEGAEFTTIDPAVVEDPINRFGEFVRGLVRLGWTWTTAVSTFSYYYFEYLVWRRFGQALRRGEFDIVHRVTPLSPVTPSLIMAGHCRRLGVPFVWGPANGGVAWPKEFRNALHREGEWLSYVRGSHRILPGYALTRSAAAALIAGSVSVWQQMQGHHERCVYLPENAIDPHRFPMTEPAVQDGPLRVAFVGRLVPYKGADMLVDAATPLVRAGKLEVEIIGDGPEMGPLRRQVTEANVADGIALPGWIDHRMLAPRLARSQVFAFPSIREFGGGVVLEAMALGLAPVVVDYAGPGELVTAETGFRVPLGSRAATVSAFGQILSELAASPGHARVIGDRARRRVYRLFTWDVKARQILEVYRWVMGERAKPDFGMPLLDSATESPVRDHDPAAA